MLKDYRRWTKKRKVIIILNRRFTIIINEFISIIRRWINKIQWINGKNKNLIRIIWLNVR